MKYSIQHLGFLLLFAYCLSTTLEVKAQYVYPSLGGNQESPMTGALMKHAGINFDGTNLEVHLDEFVATPVLRELEAPNEFDPAKPWSLLTNKAYNAQHGWVIEGTWTPPAGLAVWIKELSSSPALEVYEGGRYMNPTMIEMQTFDPIFGTQESSEAWQWNGVMTHNAYAVKNPTQATYEATYEVYLGHATTGVPSASYGSDTVTFAFIGVPEPTSAWLLIISTTAFFCSFRRK